jgi:Ca2+-binding RTX toxin-like protein
VDTFTATTVVTITEDAASIGTDAATVLAALVIAPDATVIIAAVVADTDLSSLDPVGTLTAQLATGADISANDNLTTVDNFSLDTEASVTMTIAQHDKISSAAGTETVTLSAAGTVVGNSTIEIYNLAAGDNTFTTDAVGQTVVGNTGADNITGLGGNDTISGGDGGDLIDGGDGDDVINAGLGSDVVYGGLGSDVFRITSADITTGYDVDTITFYGDFTSGDDTIDLAGFSFRSLLDSVDGDAATYGADDVVNASISLTGESRVDDTLLYYITSVESSFDYQESIDIAVAEIMSNASPSIFASGESASVLIQVVGSDGDDVALFHYTETNGSNGIQVAELDLLGVFVGADVLSAVDIL